MKRMRPGETSDVLYVAIMTQPHNEICIIRNKSFL